MDLGDLESLRLAIASGRVGPVDIVETVIEGIELARRPEAWLHVVDAETLRRRARELEALGESGRALPLYGVPFAIKDNIDAAGIPTTAGCPAFAYTPRSDAFVVARLVEAGAILVGKTHMDQFATGLVGTRSPFGPCRNAHVADHISGGSSSGSAVVTAEGLVGFALGTDTAGSGRVPAVLNGVVGLKPTRGRLSLRGVVPACASLDCISIFARSAADASQVLTVAAAHDAADPFSRMPSRSARPRPRFRFGVPRIDGLPALDSEGMVLFARAVAHLEAAGGEAVEFDYAPLLDAAALLYGGAWVAERATAVGDFLAHHPEAVDGAVATILGGAGAFSARHAFEDAHRLAEYRRRVRPLWQSVDLVVVPTVPRTYTIAEALAEPLEASRVYGAYNNFLNLLDMAAVAVPTGLWSSAVPFGVTLSAPAFSEPLLIAVASALERETRGLVPRLAPERRIRLAVVGAHLRGLPLHHQIAERGGRFVAEARTTADYRLYALAGSDPARPGLLRVAGGGAAIEVEVWSLAPAEFGDFVASVPRPLSIGRVSLAGGDEVSGFLCEADAVKGARDISEFGGWRAWLAAPRATPASDSREPPARAHAATH